MSSALFGPKNKSSNLEYFCKKPYQTWSAAVKTLKKHQNVPTKTHKKNQISLNRSFDEHT